MAREDLNKFRELLFADTDFQEKLAKKAEAYTGDKSEEAVFENVLLPLAKEYGLSATYDEYKEYTAAFAGVAGSELSDDELAQVAGGKVNGGGIGGMSCAGLGTGLGGGGGAKGGGLCGGIGFGWNDLLCFTAGVSKGDL